MATVHIGARPNGSPQYFDQNERFSTAAGDTAGVLGNTLRLPASVLKGTGSIDLAIVYSQTISANAKTGLLEISNTEDFSGTSIVLASSNLANASRSTTTHAIVARKGSNEPVRMASDGEMAALTGLDHTRDLYLRVRFTKQAGEVINLERLTVRIFPGTQGFDFRV